MGTIDQINKIQETLRGLQSQLEALKDTIAGVSSPVSPKESMKVKDHLKSIAMLNKKQDPND